MKRATGIRKDEGKERERRGYLRRCCTATETSSRAGSITKNGPFCAEGNHCKPFVSPPTSPAWCAGPVEPIGEGGGGVPALTCCCAADKRASRFRKSSSLAMSSCRFSDNSRWERSSSSRSFSSACRKANSETWPRSISAVPSRQHRGECGLTLTAELLLLDPNTLSRELLRVDAVGSIERGVVPAPLAQYAARQSLATVLLVEEVCSRTCPLRKAEQMPKTRNRVEG